MAKQQTAIRVTDFDSEGFKNLKVTQEDIPSPGPDEVLIRVLLRPINPTDVFSLTGAWGGDPNFVPGSEGVGVIEEVGSGVKNFKKGDKVVAVPLGPGDNYQKGSSWQQYVVVSAVNVYKVPEGLDDKTAAQFYINPSTVLGFFKVLQVPNGEYILQAAAGSVLGRQLIQYAKHVGVKSINIVRRDEHVDELKALGADEVIDSSTEDVVKRVMEITGGKGAHSAVDPVGGEVTAQLLKSVREEGTVLMYGALAGGKAEVEAFTFLTRQPYLTGFLIYSYLKKMGPEKARAHMEETLKVLADGIITPYSGRSFPLEQVREAVQESLRDARGPKIFLEG